MKYVVKFEKKSIAKYISHLDFQRTVSRAMRRAELPLAYSHGFNPHPLLSFAAPLAVGITSECELFEAELYDEVDENIFTENLNNALPSCIRIIEVKKDSLKNCPVNAGVYRIECENTPSGELIARFMKNETIEMDKKTKSGIKKVDIKTDIFGISVNNNVMELTLAAGSQRNLRPFLVIDAIKEYTGHDCGYCRFHRVRLVNVS